MNKKFSKLYFLLAFAFLLPAISFASTVTGEPSDTGVSTTSAKIINPIKGIDNINDFIKIILQGAIKIGIPIIALAIIYSGFLFVQARGNPEAIKEAKSALMYTLIGAAILLGAWAIAQLISNTILAI